jgi:serine/threonine protein kinase
VKLKPATRVSAYEIASLIGEGGMGEVYRARDLRLGRDVAIKVLPESLADNRERLARFEQEAWAAASITHPNILVVYDVGDWRGLAPAGRSLPMGEQCRAGGTMAGSCSSSVRGIGSWSSVSVTAARR